jgi:two-component system OmpR family sensor kinase
VFERFARGDASRSRNAGSTGLGLAIVHAVVAAHGGRVEVASEPGRTVFTVRLPHATETPGD